MRRLIPDLFHIAALADWEKAQAHGQYARSTRGVSLADVGYLHASFAWQVEPVARAFYGDCEDPLVLLQIDPDLVGAEIRMEALASGEHFPHLYGPLPVQAVVAVLPFHRVDGEFRLPATLTSPAAPGSAAFRNVEIKARCPRPGAMLTTLLALGAVSHGVDTQLDSYFDVPYGRLKVRQGALENAVVHYLRPDQPGPKESQVRLCETTVEQAAALAALLTAALTVAVVVDKTRHILWIDNVKFHLDQVHGLGSYLEIEAIDREGLRTHAHLQEQCAGYVAALGLGAEQLEARSYRDLLGERRTGT